MTGAHKQSAMNLIDQTEEFERNFYSGTLGFIQADGNFDLPVVIRTLFYNEIKKELSFSVGGAITYLSNPEEELQECLLKAQTMIKAVNAQLEWD
jgi:para-aminobenzoate synthetase component 1